MKFRMPWFILAVALMFAIGFARADDTAYFSYGPLSLNIPLKTVNVTYLFDFHQNRSLVGGETPVLTLWSRLEGDVGAITSLQGAGTPFVGGNLLIGNILDKYVTLPPDLKIGGYGGYDFNGKVPIYGLKGSYKIW